MYLLGPSNTPLKIQELSIIVQSIRIGWPGICHFDLIWNFLDCFCRLKTRQVGTDVSFERVLQPLTKLFLLQKLFYILHGQHIF